MKPDLVTIEAFLNRIGERQRQTLAFIHPVKTGLEGMTFEASQKKSIIPAIIRKQTQGYGVYYSLNEGVPVFQQRGFNGKLLADEITKVHMLGFDIDWTTGNEADRANFEKMAIDLVFKCHTDFKPNMIVSSGGGIQLLYSLCAPLQVALSRAKIPTPDEAKKDAVAKSFRDDFTLLYADIVAQLSVLLAPMIKADVLKIDKLSNIDRVFRLPGTINFPTQAKIDKGATIKMARLVYDQDEYSSFEDLRDCVPRVTEAIEKKAAPKAVVDRPGMKWTVYNKMEYLCKFARDNMLIDDNGDYTHAFMFPLFGAINRREITAQQGRDLWLMATSTARTPAYGTWAKKWDTRKIENYTGRDIGSMIHFCREKDCLLPWSGKDQEKEYLKEAAEIAADSMRRPVLVDEDDFI